MFKEFISREENQLANKSYILAKKCHDGQFRDEGSPYITHPEAVVDILLGHGVTDVVAISAGFLHDVVEDCDVSYHELANEVGFRVADIVENLTKTPDVTMREYLAIIADCLDSSLLKASDRLHNIRSLKNASPEKQERYSKMTQKYFIPFLISCEEKHQTHSSVFKSIRTEIEELIS